MNLATPAKWCATLASPYPASMRWLAKGVTFGMGWLFRVKTSERLTLAREQPATWGRTHTPQAAPAKKGRTGEKSEKMRQAFWWAVAAHLASKILQHATRCSRQHAEAPAWMDDRQVLQLSVDLIFTSQWG